jgi:uncharacterized membrane protein YidH (DUF202 family)
MATKSERALLLAEEQTILARERTMHSYMQTGLAFISIGLLILKFLEGSAYLLLGSFLALIGFLELGEAFRRFTVYRREVRELRAKEKRLGIEIWK